MVMDATALLYVVGGAILLSIILASSLCTYCWGHKQPTSIHQRSSDSSPEDTSLFMVRHHNISTYAPHPDQRVVLNHQLHNSLSSPSITVTKVNSCPPSETGSQASYVNHDQPEDLPYVQQGSDYIVVLPDSPTTKSHASRASSQSSVDFYINIESEDTSNHHVREAESDSESDSHAYENYQKSPDLRTPTRGMSYDSVSSDNESSDYVNTDLHKS